MHLLNSGWGASTRNCAHRQQLRLAAGPAMRAGHLTLPSSGGKPKQVRPAAPPHGTQDRRQLTPSANELRSLLNEIGRASCREGVCQYVYISGVAGSLKKKKEQRMKITKK